MQNSQLFIANIGMHLLYINDYKYFVIEQIVRSWCEHFAFYDSLMRKLQAHVSGEFWFSIYGRWEIRKQFEFTIVNIHQQKYEI